MSKSKEDKFNIFVEDLKKIASVDKIVESVKTTKLESPLNELLTYGINVRIVDSAADLLELCVQIPEIKDLAVQIFDSIQKKRLEEAQRSNYCSTGCRC